MIDLNYIRDFYDTLFLWQRTQPDYTFLVQSAGISNQEQLMDKLCLICTQTNLSLKQRDFEHLLFDPHKSETIMHFMSIMANSSSSAMVAPTPSPAR